MKTSYWIVLGMAATIAVGFFLFGRSTEQVPTEPKFEVPAEAASADDLTQGLYEVTYTLVQKGPWPNPALMERTVVFYSHTFPDAKKTKTIIRIPAYIARRKYVFCDDCSVFVKELRRPQAVPIEEKIPLQ